MAIVLRFTLTAALLISPAIAPCGAATQSAETEVAALEKALWAAWKAHDLRPIARLTAPDYYSISEDGPARAIGLADLKRVFPDARIRDYRLGQMVARRIGSDSIVVVYNAHIFGSYEGKDLSRGVAEASAWVRRNGAWRNVLLHEITRTTRDSEVDP